MSEGGHADVLATYLEDLFQAFKNATFLAVSDHAYNFSTNPSASEDPGVK